MLSQVEDQLATLRVGVMLQHPYSHQIRRKNLSTLVEGTGSFCGLGTRMVNSGAQAWDADSTMIPWYVGAWYSGVRGFSGNGF